MIQETINSMRLTLNERIGNPFISAAVIAFILVNWKLTLLLISTVPYDSKVEKVLSLYSDSSVRFYSLLIIPLFFGAFWTFIWPIINMGINAYWYWMKSNISNVRHRAERKKTLSEAEAAELYSIIDSQESKYLEFLKDRQSKIDSRSKQIESLINDREAMLREIEEIQSSSKNLEMSNSELTLQLSNEKSESDKIRHQNEIIRFTLDEIAKYSLNAARYFPGLKAFTNAINKSTNYQANEAWIKEQFKHQEPQFTNEEMHDLLNFFLAINLLKRNEDGQITFGDQYRYVKDKILGMYNNSPDMIKSM